MQIDHFGCFLHCALGDLLEETCFISRGHLLTRYLLVPFGCWWEVTAYHSVFKESVLRESEAAVQF